jgi:hypothetical protein
MEKSEIKAILRHLENNQENMSANQVDFINGLKKYYTRNNKLSPRQVDALVSIHENVTLKVEEKGR